MRSMSCTILPMLAFLLLPTGLLMAADAPSNAASPVLVELFTSEGCSSCPPADVLLTKLDGSQPVPGAQVIVLSEHVDYWNHDGWRDVYSSSFFTDRQGAYVRRLGAKGAYTPQMVIDGGAELNGSDVAAVDHAIKEARGHVKIPVRISSVSLADAKTIRLHLAVDALPANFKGSKADILVAVALDHAESHVSAGENKGRDIRHVAVAESINKVGTAEKGKNFERDVTIKVKAGAEMGNLRLVAFVQGSDAGEVVGAAQANTPGKN
jgi:hypothetical protein